MQDKPRVEIKVRGIRSSKSIDERVRRLVESRLVPVCDHINRCDVAIERSPGQQREGGRKYRVRLDITVPPSHRIVVSRAPQNANPGHELLTAVQDAFRAARKRLQKVTELQRREFKFHPE